MNRNDYQSGWDTDQFPNNVHKVALAYYQILGHGEFEDGNLQQNLVDRYARWASDFGGEIMYGHHGLESLANKVIADDINPDPVSGKQEYLENTVNRFV